MKWPGLIPLLARIITLPFALILGFIALAEILVEDGMNFWTDVCRKK